MDITLASNYEIITCAECGMHFAAPKKFINERRDDHKSFYCPSGHSQYFPQKSDKEMLRSEVENLKKRLDYKNNEALALKNSRAAYKAHLTRLKNKNNSK